MGPGEIGKCKSLGNLGLLSFGFWDIFLTLGPIYPLTPLSEALPVPLHPYPTAKAETSCTPPLTTLVFLGLKVNRLDMYGEKYKPFKGIKYMTKAGKFQVRT